MKKAITVFLSLALAGAIAVPAFAANSEPPSLSSGVPGMIAENTAGTIGNYKIQVNGQDIGVNACIMVPLRGAAEALGFTVSWNDGYVLVDNGIIHTEVTPGVDSYTITTSAEGLVGMSAPFSLGVAPYVAGGTTFVPLSLFDALSGGNGAVSIDDSKIMIRTGGTTGMQLPNPFVDCEDMEEAAQLAGFAVTAPDDVGSAKVTVVRALKGEMIEVIYGDNAACIRKGMGSRDISGDYNEYDEENTVTVDGLQVTMKGAEGRVNLAIWTDGSYTFSVRDDRGMSVESMTGLIQTIQ